jgi:hypothetical protein
VDCYTQLVTEINAINHAWHDMQDLLSNESPMTTSLRDIKGRLQLRLLRQFSDRVYLTPHSFNSSGEELYSVKLKLPVTVKFDGETKKLTDAMHLPKRKVKNWLETGLVTESELQGWLVE